MPDAESTTTEFKFEGFPAPEQNYSKMPHCLIDALPQMRSEAEVKCVLYILRHTWGYSEYDEPKHMTLDEFQRGRKRKDGSRLDNGTGLTKPSVIKGLRAAEKHGFIEIKFGDISDGGRVEKLYRLAMRKEPLPEQSTVFTGGVKNLYTSEESDETGKESLQVEAPMGKESLHRTEKETIQKETKDSAADAAKPAKPKKPRAPKADPEVSKAIGAVIKAWKDALPADPISDVYQNRGIRKVAEEIHKAGYTPEQITRYMEAQYEEPFWRGKYMKLEHVALNMPAWMASHNGVKSTSPNLGTLDGILAQTREREARLMVVQKASA